MKYLKMLGLAAIAAAALTAFLGAGTASATVLCKTTVTTNCGASWDWPSGTELDASLEAGTKAKLTSAWTTVNCTSSTIKGTTTNTGSANETVHGNISEMTFTGCTCGLTGSREAHVSFTQTGQLEVHHISGTDDGTLTAKSQIATINCTGLGQCEYKTAAAGTHIGTWTSHSTTVDAKATLLYQQGHDSEFVCGGSALWEASYTQTAPSGDVYISAS